MDERQLELSEDAVARNGSKDGADADDRAVPSTGKEPGWMGRMKSSRASSDDLRTSDVPEKATPGSPPRSGGGSEAPPDSEHRLHPEVERLREEARRLARADAQQGIPAPGASGPTQSELELKDRCIGFFEFWHAREKRRLSEEIGEREERISGTLGAVEMKIDRFQRMINELLRLKARHEIRKREVNAELGEEGRTRGRGIPTGIYVGALAFLGLVEFFANAPVFSSLLPRDPLTESQIRLFSETATGWFAGLERVGAHILFRPDAALLAAGVITFLCVLAHFFGHSLRDLVMQGERKERRQTVHSRSVKENVVPMVLSAMGLLLTLGVLYEARLQLGEVGEERYVTDMTQVEELRRQAGWLRVDGEILQANQLSDQAEDMEAAATELRAYSGSMARMNLPIMLLNLTLVLCAISAAYFHRRDAIREQFNEAPFEDERRAFIHEGERYASETAGLLPEVVKDLRALKTLASHGAVDEWRSMVRQLESVFATYRAENRRARNLDSESTQDVSSPVRLDVDVKLDQGLTLRDPEDYERERTELASRFRELRTRFNDEATASW